MKKNLICGVGLAGLILAGCGTTPTERAATGGLAGAALGAAVGDSALTGALVGGAAGAAIGYYTAPKTGERVDRRQYWDARAGRYYFQDRSTGRYYWENGAPRY
ncbi:hypothetical protein LJR225_000712 [Phenylobacterium sp. LjRoot225]|uniref:hypothetical protein n=1 Tax=Phenylobacterium sp. LjRoot225 TaxID=3342285 RepID=UPI003ECE72DA